MPSRSAAVLATASLARSAACSCFPPPAAVAVAFVGSARSAELERDTGAGAAPLPAVVGTPRRRGGGKRKEAVVEEARGGGGRGACGCGWCAGEAKRASKEMGGGRPEGERQWSELAAAAEVRGLLSWWW